MTTPNADPGNGAAVPPVAAMPPVWEPASDADAPEEVSGTEIAPPAISRTRARVPARRANSTTSLLVVAALVAFGGVGFAVGHVTGSGQTGTGTGTQSGLSGFGANASGAPGFGDRVGLGGTATMTGTVVSVSADSITLQLTSGSAVTIATGSSTTYHNQTSGSITDLAAGQTVQVQTSGGANAAPNASASPGTQTTRTATDVTITS